MGNKVGKLIVGRITKPLKNFNVESRAHKVISQEKPKAAPKHKSTELVYEQMMKEYPEVYEASLKKHEQLDRHLKDIYVKSYDPVAPQQKQENPERSLPLDRTAVGDFEYGVKEPEKTTLGKVTLRKALEFITDHQAKPKIETATKIAIEYNLPETTVKNILHYYKVMQFYLPQERDSRAIFVGPGMAKIELVRRERKQLGSGIRPEKEDVK